MEREELVSQHKYVDLHIYEDKVYDSINQEKREYGDLISVLNSIAIEPRKALTVNFSIDDLDVQKMKVILVFFDSLRVDSVHVDFCYSEISQDAIDMYIGYVERTQKMKFVKMDMFSSECPSVEEYQNAIARITRVIHVSHIKAVSIMDLVYELYGCRYYHYNPKVSPEFKKIYINIINQYRHKIINDHCIR